MGDGRWEVLSAKYFLYTQTHTHTHTQTHTHTHIYIYIYLYICTYMICVYLYGIRKESKCLYDTYMSVYI